MLNDALKALNGIKDLGICKKCKNLAFFDYFSGKPIDYGFILTCGKFNIEQGWFSTDADCIVCTTPGGHGRTLENGVCVACTGYIEKEV